jgi:hypothetical protein
MNTGQMMLTAGALILLGVTVMSVNRNNLQNGTILRQTELGIYAVSLATSYVQHATSLAFDERTVVRPVLPTNPLPVNYLSAILGREYTHLHPVTIPPMEPNELLGKPRTFDDIDDYNNFVVDTSIANVDTFYVTARVYYVSIGQLYSSIGAPSWLKRIDFSVSNSVSRRVFDDPTSTIDRGTDTIKMSYIRSYY